MIWYAIKRGIAWGIILGLWGAIGLIAGHLIMVGS